MKAISTAFLAAVAALLLYSRPSSAEDIHPSEVPVAWYSIVPDHTKDGDRIMELLLQHRIRAVASVSDSVTVTVAPDNAERAREAISFAIRNGKLRVTLLPVQPKQSKRKTKSQ